MMKARFRSRWLGLLLVAVLAVTLTAGTAYAQANTFQWEGLVQAINPDGSLVVVPTQGGQATGGPMTVGIANAYIASQVQPGELVLFQVEETANGSLIAYDASVEQSNYALAPPPVNNYYYGNYGYYPYSALPGPAINLQFGFPGQYPGGRGYYNPGHPFNGGERVNPGNRGFVAPQGRTFVAPQGHAFVSPSNRSFTPSPTRGATSPSPRNAAPQNHAGSQSRGGGSNGNQHRR